MKSYNIATLPGDGIGKEVMPQCVRVLETVAEISAAYRLQFEYYPWGCEYCLETGEVMPKDGIDILRPYDAIYFVAAGHPDVIDHRSAWEFIFLMRKHFRQYINLRPVRSYSGVKTLLAKDSEIDFVIVRENSEGEYAGPGGIVHQGFENSVATQTSVYTRHGVERAARYAFELASRRRKHLTNVTKSNALRPSLVFWDEVIESIREDYPDVTCEKLYVDAATMTMVRAPQTFDVILTTNLFGDILSDLGGAIIGSIGLSPSTNMNPQREFPSMFEPVHGSAPDIAGMGIANPIGTILAGAMMLEHLGEGDSAGLIRVAVEKTLGDGIKSGDLGGNCTTVEMTDAIIGNIRAMAGAV